MCDNHESRRAIRLPGFDYAETGRYFVTLCACDMHCLFGRMENGAVLLGPIGQIADSRWREIPSHFPHVLLDAFVVMPNHVHGILILTRGQGADRHGNAVPLQGMPEGFQRPVAGSIPTIVRSYKSAVTYQAGRILRRKGMRLWQSNYFERVLRDDKEYLAASRYILENPSAWHRDKLHR